MQDFMNVIDLWLSTRQKPKQFIVKEDDGTIVYYLGDKIHRKRGPAILRPNGTIEYWINGVRSRSGNKPAVITKYGLKFYYIDGILKRKSKNGTYKCPIVYD